MQHITQDTTQHLIHTEHNISHNPAQYRYNNTHKPQHRTTHLYAQLFIYSFDFYDEHIYIKKLYNTAIYKLYTNFIHFGHLINKVSKITNIDILIKTYT